MIQIDDAGSGSLIGGTGIGIYDTDTDKYYFDIIPLKYYQTKLYEKKIYQYYVIKIIKKAFLKLGITKKHEIAICQGYIFDKSRIWLSKNNYHWYNTKIENPLQDKVENSFDEYVINLGLPKPFIKHARYAFGFHRLLKWVFADLENRKHFCKTQWKSWQKWGNIKKSIYINTITHSDFCLKCGGKIDAFSEIISIEYKTNKPTIINLHKECFKGKLQLIPPDFLKDFYTKVKLNNKSLDCQKIKSEEILNIKIIQDQINIVSSKGYLVGQFNNYLSNKLLFWYQKGFKWKCQVKEINEGQLILKVILIT